MAAGVLTRPRPRRHGRGDICGQETGHEGEGRHRQPAGRAGHSVPRVTNIPHPRFFLFLALLFGSIAGAFAYMRPEEAVVFGFNIAALGFIAVCIPLFLKDQPEDLRRRGARDDGGRVFLLLSSIVVLAAVVASLTRMIRTRETLNMPDLLQVMATLILAWLFVNLIYAHHYGHMYYDQIDQGDAGGLAFPGEKEPVFVDFCYFAFCIGMTSAVSDVNVESRSMRRTVTLHALLAFLFNLGILALVINVLSSVF
jgi:uncharacterized membrane protein